MSNEIVVAESQQDEPERDAEPSHAHAREQAKNTHSERKRQRKIPSPEDCWAMLGELPGLITMKIITPGQANAITRVLQTLLQSRTSQTAASGLPIDEINIEILRANPSLLELVEPMLTDEQIAMVLRGVKDDSHAET